MIVGGDCYERIAALTIPRAEQVLNHPVTTIAPPPNTPAHLFKLDLFQHFSTEHILLIDSDIVFFNWDWADFEPSAFNAVRSQNLHKFPPILQAVRNYIPEPSPLFNTGLWLAPRALADVFSQASKHLKPGGRLLDFMHNFQDETPTNLALHENQAPVHVLPNKYNKLHHIWQQPYLPPPEDSFGVHLLSGDPEKKLERIQAYCEKYPLTSNCQSPPRSLLS